MGWPRPFFSYSWREGALIAVAVITLLAALSLDPIAQDLRYHDLSDRRTFFGIANFFNVVSNLPFLVIGIAGIFVGARDGGAMAAWRTFFAGVAMVAIGSAYYHANPTNATLVWDRIPMTVAFMALFVGVLGEHLHPRLTRRLLLPALALGLASVVWWHYTDDLRFYGWVQFAPLVMMVLVALLFHGQYTHRHYLAYGLGFYLLAKAAEHYDTGIYELSGNLMSGHSLKHLLAALAPLYVYLMLLRRRRAGTIK